LSELRQPEDRLWVTTHERLALVRVVGRGSFKVSTALKDFGLASQRAGAQVAVLDMTGCIGMDSTFMGVLAGWATRLRDQEGGRMVLINLSARTRGLVATLGLDRIVQAYEAGPLPDDIRALAQVSQGLSALEAPEESQAATAATMIEAHENLVHLSADNAPRFKDVLMYLREDLRKKAGEQAEPK
jgi:anti-anti-sigma factor